MTTIEKVLTANVYNGYPIVRLSDALNAIKMAREEGFREGQKGKLVCPYCGEKL